MAKKPSKATMLNQLNEKPVESPGNALLRDEIAMILSEELAKAEESAPVVLRCGTRGLQLQFVEEPSNYIGHVLQLTKAVSGMQRAIEVAQRSGASANWFEDDLNAALAGTELISNLAAEYAKLVPNG